MAAQLATGNTYDPSLTAHADYQQFSCLPLFACTDNDSHAMLATPALALAWAKAVVDYWHAGLSNLRINTSQSLYILDLNPGRGQFAWLMLKTLRAQLQASGRPCKPCYLACSTQTETLTALSQHPYLQASIEEHCFDTALFHPSYDALHLQHQNQTLLRTDNPIVVIGLNHFQTLPSELFGVHHGKILEGRVAVERIQDDEPYRLNYQWQETAAPALAAPLLEKYLARCSSASVLLPLAACAQLDALSRISAGRYLLLSADVGVCTEQAIRLGALGPPAQMQEDGIVIPVNTHALLLHQQQHGALTWHQQLRDGGIAVLAACKDGDARLDAGPDKTAHAQGFETISNQLSAAHPDDFCHDPVAAIDPANPASVAFYLNALRRSHYDPQLLKAIIQHLINHTEMMETSLRRSWQEALARTMENYFPNATNDALYYQSGLCAIGLGDFSCARQYFQRSMDWYDEDATELYLLAYCEAASGGVALAHQLLQRALSLDTQHSHSMNFLPQIEERLNRWQHNRGRLPNAAQDGELRLEPLGREHAASLLYQYRDEQIGIMTRLPELTTVEQVQEWIVEQGQDENRTSCAVMHQRWGFVGVVSMHCAGTSGYFYFWIGCDFQDQGFGQRAAPVLFDMMARQGVVDVFTSAYEDNSRSIHALTRLGFGKLALRAQEPDETLGFFHLDGHDGRADDAQVLHRLLIELCRAIDSPLQFS